MINVKSNEFWTNIWLDIKWKGIFKYIHCLDLISTLMYSLTFFSNFLSQAAIKRFYTQGHTYSSETSEAFLHFRTSCSDLLLCSKPESSVARVHTKCSERGLNIVRCDSFLLSKLICCSVLPANGRQPLWNVEVCRVGEQLDGSDAILHLESGAMSLAREKHYSFAILTVRCEAPAE